MLLETALRLRGHDVTAVENGRQAQEALQGGYFPVLVTDYDMPELNGFELAQSVRASRPAHYTYVILVTVLGGRTNHLEAIEAGVDDFLSKPYDPDLLQARLHVAERIVGLHRHVRRLEGLLSICSNCKRIRDDHDTWRPLETYLSRHSAVRFSHGVCPECAERFALEAARLLPSALPTSPP